MQVVENVALISINATMLVQLISFLIFMVLFNRIMIRPLRKVMAERETYMVDVRDEIVAIDHSYRDISRKIAEQESEARQTAFQIRSDIEAAGQRSVQELMVKTKDEINGLRLAAQKETDARIDDARKNVASEAEQLANQMIEAILDRKRSLS